MTEQNTTIEQNNAYTVKLVGKHLMEAGAGTGKTYNIVSLFLRMVLGGIPVKKILVVTFTEAATAELVNRLHKGLEEMKNALQSNNDSKVDDQCNPFLDEAQWDTIFDKGKFFDSYGWASPMPSVEEGRKKMLRLVNQALLDFDQAPISTIHGFCRSVLNENVFESGVQFGLQMRASFDDVKYEAATDFCRNVLYNPSILALLNRLDIKLTPSDILNNVKNVIDLSANDVDWGVSVSTSLDLDSFCQYYQHNSAILEYEPALANKEEQKQIKDIREDAQMTLRLIAAKAIKEAVEKHKRDEGEMSFNDLLTQVRDILRKEAISTEQPLTNKIRERYDAVLVDEFQDTDEIQYSIFEWIFAGNWHEPGKHPQPQVGQTPPKSFFMIGDPKQAIYAFRGGDLDTYQIATEGKVRDECLALTTNHRSSDIYIDEMNDLFRKVIPVSSFLNPEKKLEWKEIEKQPQGKSPRFLKKVSEDEYQDVTEDLLTCDNFFTTDCQPESEVTIKHLVQEIQGILDAELYQQILKKNDSEEEIKINERINASDIAVLVNSNQEGVIIQKALSDAGIPSQWFGDTSIFTTDEAPVLLQLMECLLDLGNSRLILKTLSNPLFGCKAMQLDELRDKSLAQIQTFLGDISQKWLNKSFLTAFDKLIHASMEEMTGQSNAEKTDSLAMKIRRGIDGERALAHYFQLAEVLNSVAIERHLGRQGLLVYLKRKVDEASKNNSTLWNKEKERDTISDEEGQDDARFHIRLTSENPAVQVMTAHKSKGLQFPIIFAFNILRKKVMTEYGGTYHDKDRRRRYYLNPLSESLDERDADPATNALYEQYDEMRRLFYVVVTRARYLCRFIDQKTSSSKTLYALLAEKQDGPHPLPYKEKLEFLSSTSKENPQATSSKTYEALNAEKIHPVPGWSTISFSSLSPMHREFLGNNEQKTDNPETSSLKSDEGEEPDSSETDKTEKEAPIFEMPSGTAAGTCWHLLFEHLDFQWGDNPEERKNGQTLKEWIGSQLSSQFHGTEEKKADQLNACLDVILGILCNPLPLGFALKDIPPEKRCSELRFTFKLKNGFLAGKIVEHTQDQNKKELKYLQDTVLQSLWQNELDFPENWSRCYHAENGHNLTGSIDLLFEHNGKTFILDWKTNNLKNDFHNFSQNILRDAMRINYYPFQYLLYTVAWMRFYDSLTPRHEWTEKEYLEHFGGCLYIFCRGVSQNAKGEDTEWPRGFHFVSPSDKNGLLRWEVVEKLYKWLDVSASIQPKQN
ncbi:MAG: UvrD-helicase domain-containing protein [Victivallales bacterium]|nr:UvrD-helicase domain-containing protein [Victivallales bacterium]